MSDDQYITLKTLIEGLTGGLAENTRRLATVEQGLMSNSRETAQLRIEVNNRLNGVMTTEMGYQIIQGQADFAKQWADHQEDRELTDNMLKRHDSQLHQLATAQKIELTY